MSRRRLTRAVLALAMVSVAPPVTAHPKQSNHWVVVQVSDTSIDLLIGYAPTAEQAARAVWSLPGFGVKAALTSWAMAPIRINVNGVPVAASEMSSKLLTGDDHTPTVAVLVTVPLPASTPSRLPTQVGTPSETSTPTGVIGPQVEVALASEEIDISWLNKSSCLAISGTWPSNTYRRQVASLLLYIQACADYLPSPSSSSPAVTQPVKARSLPTSRPRSLLSPARTEAALPTPRKSR